MYECECVNCIHFDVCEWSALYGESNCQDFFDKNYVKKMEKEYQRLVSIISKSADAVRTKELDEQGYVRVMLNINKTTDYAESLASFIANSTKRISKEECLQQIKQWLQEEINNG